MEDIIIESNAEELSQRIINNPMEYPLMVLNPNVPDIDILKISGLCYVYIVKFNGEVHNALLPNVYRHKPHDSVRRGAMKIGEGMEDDEVDTHFEGTLDLKDRAVMLFKKDISEPLEEMYDNRYITETIRWEQEPRKGVTCVYLDQRSRLNYEPAVEGEPYFGVTALERRVKL